MDETIKSLLPWAPAIGLFLAIWVAKKNGVFSRKKIKLCLFGLDDEKKPVKEVIFWGPLATQNVLIPITVRVSNAGTAPAKGLEVSLEGYSDVVVNYPKLFISPSISSALKTVDTSAVRLANNRFRRLFCKRSINPTYSPSPNLNLVKLFPIDIKRQQLVYL